MSSITRVERERLTQPLRETGSRFWALFAISGVVTVAVGLAWLYQLSTGMAVTNLRDWGTMGGAPWGLYIGTFIWWVGIAHGGIAISASVRLFDLETYLPIARVAEVLTLIALPMAAANILFDLGRPDVVYWMLVNYPTVIQTSPLAWDMTAIFLYFTLSASYLWLTVRGDVYRLREDGTLPETLSPIYDLILLGYRPGKEEEKTRQMAWWLAMAVLILVPLLSGGVVPWLYATMGMHPGWFGAAQGPAMLAESLTSAMAAVMIVAAVFRYAYGWDDIIGDDVFWGLNKALVVLVLATLWFVLQDIVVGLGPGAPTEEAEIVEAMLWGSVAPVFWTAMVLLGAGFAYLVAARLRPELFSVAASAVAAAAITVAILLKKTLFVVEGLLHPTREPMASMFPTGSYVPSVLEVVIAFGTIGVAVFAFLIVTKIIPIIEVEKLEVTKR